MRQLIPKYIFTLLTAAFILYISVIHISTNPLPQLQNLDKIVHILMYFGLMTIMGIETIRANPPLKSIGKKLFLPWVIVVLYGGIIELLQAYCTTNRNGDWYDWIGNILGASLSMAGLWLTILIINRKNRVSTPL